MDATIFISDQPARTCHFHKGLPAGTKLSFVIECSTGSDCPKWPDATRIFYSSCLTKKTSRSQTGDKSMKSKILIATLLGCLAWQQGALSQTDTIATNPAATDEVAPANQARRRRHSASDARRQHDGSPRCVRNIAAAPPAAPAAGTTEAPGCNRRQCRHQRVGTRTVPGTASSNETASATPAPLGDRQAYP